MKKHLCWAVLLFFACNNENNDLQDIVHFNLDDKECILDLQDIFSSIQIIPLQEPDSIIVNTDSNVIYDENKFYFIDSQHRKCVDIFDINGIYISSVASYGRSEKEYIGINDVQLINQMVAIYSSHNKAMYYYNIDGSFVKKDLFDCAPRRLWKDNNHYWGYMGFSNGKIPERVIKIDKDGRIATKYMPSSATIIPMSERGPVFTPYDNLVLIRESLCNEILGIDENDEVQVFIKFDFGKYNIPSKYFDQSDPYAAARRLLESDFATIDRFFINEGHAVVAVNFQFGSQNERIVSATGILCGETWHWLKTENDGPLSLFFSSIRGLTSDSDFILLVEKEQISEFAAKYPELIDHFDSFGDNRYVVLCKLK